MQISAFWWWLLLQRSKWFACREVQEKLLTEKHQLASPVECSSVSQKRVPHVEFLRLFLSEGRLSFTSFPFKHALHQI